MVKCPKCGAPMPGTAQRCNKCKADLRAAPAPESAAQNPSCPVCGAELQPRWKVCPECGSPVPPAIPVCRKCGAELKPHWKACPECGTPASAPEPAAVQTEAAAPARVEMRQEKDDGAGDNDDSGGDPGVGDSVKNLFVALKKAAKSAAEDAGKDLLKKGKGLFKR